MQQHATNLWAVSIVLHLSTTLITTMTDTQKKPAGSTLAEKNKNKNKKLN